VLEGWYAMAALRSGASAWEWTRQVLGLDWPAFEAAASSAEPGAGGVVFTPSLTGEPLLGSRPAGWTGVGPGTTRADLARAALEGVAFAVAAAADLLALPPGGPLALTGGGGRSALVPQLLADVLGRPVRRIEVRSASATGAAVLAARGAGLELAVRRSAGAVAEPRHVPGLAAAAERWREGLDGPAVAGVERPAGGHR
jgi:xylulokinase